MGADDQLMAKLKKKITNIKLVKDNLEPKITILFCVISSRIDADVTAAMNKVKGKENYNAPQPFLFLTLMVSVCYRS